MLDSLISGFEIARLVLKAQKGMNAENCSSLDKCGGLPKSDKLSPE